MFVCNNLTPLSPSMSNVQTIIITRFVIVSNLMQPLHVTKGGGCVCVGLFTLVTNDHEHRFLNFLIGRETNEGPPNHVDDY